MRTKYKFARTGLIAASGYLAACAVLYLSQRKLIYQVNRKVQGDLAPSFTRWEERGEFLGYKREQEQPDALIFMHGSAHNAREWSRVAQHFPGDVYVVEYPGYGEKEGTPSGLGLRQAGIRAFDTLPPHRGTTLLCGQSLGTGVAAAILEERGPKVQGVVLITPFTTLEAVAKRQYPMFPVKWLLRDRLAVLPAWKNYPGAGWALFAGRDEVIPAGTAEEFMNSAGPNKQVCLIPDCRHSQILLRDGHWRHFLTGVPWTFPFSPQPMDCLFPEEQSTPGESGLVSMPA